MAMNFEDLAVEVAVQVNGNSGTVTSLAVFINGEKVTPQNWQDISYNGADTTKSELRYDAWFETRRGSAKFTAQVDRWYGDAESFARDDFSGVAERVQPDVDTAANLTPSLWFMQSPAGSRTRKAAQATVAAKAFRTCPWQSYGPKAVGFALAAYREGIQHPQKGAFDVLVCSLLTDLRHLAEAYEIRLESTPKPDARPLAHDLVSLYREIRNASRGLWADALAMPGRTAGDVEHDALADFLHDCTTD
ncbi:hypothetical protein ACIA8G_35275 [Lentzea sp. NPDC051213]|uniref:hypothetical protein n=1 Tax=Lentzea sp. NPDC051213 TaxID=3364126 RepID=UPI0037B1F27B